VAPSPSWSACPDAVPLRAWRDAELAFLATALQDAYGRWRRAWGLSVPTAPVACSVAQRPVEAQEWQRLGEVPGPGAWVRWSATVQADLHSLFGPGAATALVMEAEAACLQDAHRRLAGVLGAQDAVAGEEDAAPASGPWSGAVVAALPCGSALLMAASCVARALHTADARPASPRPALPPVVPLL
jgi:hypothetical protein